MQRKNCRFVCEGTSQDLNGWHCVICQLLRLVCSMKRHRPITDNRQASARYCMNVRQQRGTNDIWRWPQSEKHICTGTCVSVQSVSFSENSNPVCTHTSNPLLQKQKRTLTHPTVRFSYMGTLVRVNPIIRCVLPGLHLMAELYA